MTSTAGAWTGQSSTRRFLCPGWRLTYLSMFIAAGSGDAQHLWVILLILSCIWHLRSLLFPRPWANLALLISACSFAEMRSNTGAVASILFVIIQVHIHTSVYLYLYVHFYLHKYFGFTPFNSLCSLNVRDFWHCLSAEKEKLVNSCLSENAFAKTPL